MSVTVTMTAETMIIRTSLTAVAIVPMNILVIIGILSLEELLMLFWKESVPYPAGLHAIRGLMPEV